MRQLIKNTTFIFFLSLVIYSKLFAQINNDSLNYQFAFEKINSIIEIPNEASFEDAIFETENAYYENALSYVAYKSKLDFHTNRILQLANANKEKLKQKKNSRY